MTPTELKSQTLRMAMAKHMTEDQLLSAITEAATLHGWRWHHVRRSDRALQMGHAGFPDLILLRGTTMLVMELKTEKGMLTSEQARWLGAFGKAEIEYFVIRPRNLDQVLSWLK